MLTRAGGSDCDCSATIPAQPMSLRFCLALRLAAPLTLLLAFSNAGSAGTLVDRLTGTVAATTYQLDIEESDEAFPAASLPTSNRHKEKHPGYLLVRELSIRCIADCTTAAPYKEKSIDSPVSAFRLWDGSPDFITIWASGSAYIVRIYHVSNGQVDKVLDQGTKTAPSFGFATDGSPMVTLNPALSVVGAFATPRTTWEWNGVRFQLTDGQKDAQ
jgi:hypothetical protein